MGDSATNLRTTIEGLWHIKDKYVNSYTLPPDDEEDQGDDEYDSGDSEENEEDESEDSLNIDDF